VPWGSAGLPASGADRDAIEAAFATLDAAVDAVGDLLLSESVYRLVTGNVAAGGASLDSLASGVRPPEPAFAEAPRSGTPISHRVALVLRDDTLPAAWTAIPLTPRALAEPRLNAWTAGLLGDPALVRCTVRVASAGGTERIAEVTLAALGMQPLDVLVVLSTLGESLGATSELDRRVAIAAGATATDTVTITYERAASETASAWRTFAEAAEVARAIAAALSVARPLAVGDLVLPEDGGEATATSAADGRAAAVQSALADAATALSNAATATAASDTTATRAALVAALMGIAAFGIAGTVPLPGAATAGLLTLAASAGTEAARRIASAAAATDDASRVAACLGAHAWYLPAFTPDGAEGLADALAARGSLVTSAREPRRWLRQAAMVREPLGAWRRAWAYGATFGSLAPAVDLVQWPGMGGRWCALPFDAPEERPRAGTTALVAWTDGGTLPSAAETWSGLLIDQWVDLIPASEETTGIAFRYDAPGAAAPQAVILAVPPTGLKAWDADTLLGTIGEAIALVRLRAVDGDLLGALAQALPAIYVAENPAGDAISLRLSDRLIADPTILGLRALGGTS